MPSIECASDSVQCDSEVVWLSLNYGDKGKMRDIHKSETTQSGEPVNGGELDHDIARHHIIKNYLLLQILILLLIIKEHELIQT